MKSLEQKLKLISEGKYTPKQFIVADAKDPDMSGGIGAAGPVNPSEPNGPYRTKQQFYSSIREIVRSGAVDIMLTSVSTLEAIDALGTYKDSHVTPAIRANDTTDIWRPRNGLLSSEPSRPFRSANLEYLKGLCDFGLYSVTFNNILDRDYASAEAYAKFRDEAVKHKFRHFLEVFNPNAPQGLSAEQIPAFVNDCILRILAGQSKSEKPLFLKIPFNGRKAMEELAGHDSSLVVGILGGSGGTTRDTFELLHQAEKSGAKVALFGRKINLAESPLDLLAMFRPVIERDLTPEAAVKEYHARLAAKSLKPVRTLEDDQAITEPVLEGKR
jgi:hypothetical protein